MANHKSSEKRARQAVRRNKINTTRKSSVRTQEKSLVKALAAKETKSLPELLKEFTAEMMRAAKTGAFKKETASRRISRLSKRVQALLTK